MLFFNSTDYTVFKDKNAASKLKAKNLNTNDKLCSELAARMREHSEINYDDNIISKLTPMFCSSSIINKTTHIRNSLLASKCLAPQSLNNSSNFNTIAQYFRSV